MAGFNKILVVAATQNELSAIPKSDKFATLVTGIGPAATALSVAQAIVTRKPDFLIQVGIAGAIDTSLIFAQALYVANDKYGDMGVWRDGCFTSFDQTIYKNDFQPNLPLQSVSGVTVSTACSPFADRKDAQVETMEGAAFYQTAQKFSIPAIQIRTISNYLDTPRSQWQIPQAINQLGPALKIVIDMLWSGM